MEDRDTKATMTATGHCYASMGASEEKPSIRVRRETAESDQINIHVGSLYYITFTIEDFRTLVETVAEIFPETAQLPA